MKKFLFFLFVLFPSLVFASNVDPNDQGWNYPGYSVKTASGAAADACHAAFSSTYTVSKIVLNSYLYNGYSTAAAWCYSPTGTEAQAGIIYGNHVYTPPPTCIAGSTSIQTYKEGSGGLADQMPTGGLGSLPSSDGACQVTPTTLERCYSVVNAAGTGKDFYCTYTVQQTGAAAASGTTGPSSPSSSSSTSPSSLPPTSVGTGAACPAGTVNMGIDSAGGVICGGSGASPQAPTTNDVAKSTTTTNSDGSTTKTDVTQHTNPDGSVTTKTSQATTASDGTVTTTTNSITGNNAAGAPGSPDKNPNDFCTLHPELNICRNSNVSGTCGQISCSGDAIQCAMLRDQADRNCKDQAAKDAITSDPAYSLGNAVMSGNDPQAGNLPSISNATVVSMPSSLDSSGWLGGGSCFPDKQFTVQGHSFTLSFTSACQPLLAFRYALMVVALLVSFRMLSGVIFRE